MKKLKKCIPRTLEGNKVKRTMLSPAFFPSWKVLRIGLKGKVATPCLVTREVGLDSQLTEKATAHTKFTVSSHFQ